MGANPRVEITLSLMTPYLAYWIPEHLGGSGVLATVAAGLYVSWNGPRLIPAATRLQGIFFWDLIIYLIEGLRVSDHRPAGAHADREGARLSGRRIAARHRNHRRHRDSRALRLDLSGDLSAALADPPLARRDPSPPWQQAFVLGFTGVRGVVSLAAALAIPLTIEGGAPFPHRDLILFATFGVIIITLVGQGLTLPAVIRWLGLTITARPSTGASRRPSLPRATKRSRHSRRHLKKLTEERKLSAETVAFLNARHDHRERLIPSDLDDGLDVIHSSNNVGWN